MKKIICAGLMMSLTTLANAVPNFWDVASQKGYDIYQINDAKGNTLNLICASGTGESGDHDAYITNAKRTYYETAYKNTASKRPLTFLINQKTVAIPPDTTKTTSSSSEWNIFKKKISGAKHIEAYWNETKIATFVPRNPSENVTISECISKFEEL